MLYSSRRDYGKIVNMVRYIPSTGELYTGSVNSEAIAALREQATDSGLMLKEPWKVQRRFQLDLPAGLISIDRDPVKLFDLCKLANEVAGTGASECDTILRMEVSRTDLAEQDHVVFFRPGPKHEDHDYITVETVLKEAKCHLPDLRR